MKLIGGKWAEWKRKFYSNFQVDETKNTFLKYLPPIPLFNLK